MKIPLIARIILLVVLAAFSAMGLYVSITGKPIHTSGTSEQAGR